MKRSTSSRKKQIFVAKPKPVEPYLEIKVRDDTPEPDVRKIVNALATISSFFGVTLSGGGGGSGGKPVKKLKSNWATLKNARSRANDVEIKVPHLPTPTLEIRVGGNQ